MLLWRVSNHLELDGEGGKRVAGRWHSVGRPIVYTAEAAALALLEALVQFEVRAELPPAYQLLRIEGPDDVERSEYPGLAPPADRDVSAAWGDDWLGTGKTALARVPAAVAPHSFNWLINPVHPDAARIGVVASGRYPWDQRLFR